MDDWKVRDNVGGVSLCPGSYSVRGFEEERTHNPGVPRPFL